MGYKEDVLVGGYPGLVEHLQNYILGPDHEWNLLGELEYKVSAQFPDGFKIQISYFSSDDLRPQLDHTIATFNLHRLSLSSGGVAVVPTPTVVPQPTEPSNFASTLQKAEVVNVVDGDTIDVLIDGIEYRVRYIGIDTPETKHPDIGMECMGPEASEANARLVMGRAVLLEKDVSDVDQYGRLLRYVWLGPDTATTFVNWELVRSGHATTSTYPPDVKYQESLLRAEQTARGEGAGLWGACN